MPLFKAEYYLCYVATSHDHRNCKLNTIYIESKSWEAARKTIMEQLEKEYEYSLVKFRSLKAVEGVIWK